MRDRELLQQALDALESWQKTCLDCGRSSEELGRATKPLQALRTRLAQPEPQPVAWFDKEMNGLKWKDGLLNCDFYDSQPFYTAPPKKEWLSLTDEEIWHLSQYNCGTRGEFAKAIEAKLKEKNNG